MKAAFEHTIRNFSSSCEKCLKEEFLHLMKFEESAMNFVLRQIYDQSGKSDNSLFIANGRIRERVCVCVFVCVCLCAGMIYLQCALGKSIHGRKRRDMIARREREREREREMYHLGWGRERAKQKGGSNRNPLNFNFARALLQFRATQSFNEGSGSHLTLGIDLRVRKVWILPANKRSWIRCCISI